MTLHILKAGCSEQVDGTESSGSSSISTSSTSGVLIVNPTEGCDERTTPGLDVPDLVDEIQDITVQNPRFRSIQSHQAHNTRIDEGGRAVQEEVRYPLRDGTKSEKNGRGLSENNWKTGVSKNFEGSEDFEALTYSGSGGYKASLLDSDATGFTSETQTIETESDQEVRQGDLELDVAELQLPGLFTVSVSSNLETKKLNEPRSPEEVLKFIGIIKPIVKDIKPNNKISELGLTISKPDVWNSILINHQNTIFPIVETKVSEPKGSGNEANTLNSTDSHFSLKGKKSKRSKRNIIEKMERVIADCWDSGTPRQAQGESDDKHKYNRNGRLYVNISRTNTDKHVDGPTWQSELEQEWEHNKHLIAVVTSTNTNNVLERKTNESSERCADEYLAQNDRVDAAIFGSENELESLKFDVDHFDGEGCSVSEGDVEWERPVEFIDSKENRLLKSFNSVDNSVNGYFNQEEFDLQGLPQQNTFNGHSIETAGAHFPKSINSDTRLEGELSSDGHEIQYERHLKHSTPEIKDRDPNRARPKSCLSHQT